MCGGAATVVDEVGEESDGLAEEEGDEAWGSGQEPGAESD